MRGPILYIENKQQQEKNTFAAQYIYEVTNKIFRLDANLSATSKGAIPMLEWQQLS